MCSLGKVNNEVIMVKESLTSIKRNWNNKVRAVFLCPYSAEVTVSSFYLKNKTNIISMLIIIYFTTASAANERGISCLIESKLANN